VQVAVPLTGARGGRCADDLPTLPHVAWPAVWLAAWPYVEAPELTGCVDTGFRGVVPTLGGRGAPGDAIAYPTYGALLPDRSGLGHSGQNLARLTSKLTIALPGMGGAGLTASGVRAICNVVIANAGVISKQLRMVPSAQFTFGSGPLLRTGGFADLWKNDIGTPKFLALAGLLSKHEAANPTAVGPIGMPHRPGADPAPPASDPQTASGSGAT
jgi:hypothetical protein